MVGWTRRTLCQVKQCESGLLTAVKFCWSSCLVVFPARQNRKIIKVIEMAADQKPFGVFQSDTDSEMTDSVRGLKPFYNERLLARRSSSGMKANHRSPC